MDKEHSRLTGYGGVVEMSREETRRGKTGDTTPDRRRLSTTTKASKMKAQSGQKNTE
jgi:hypothetical protein